MPRTSMPCWAAAAKKSADTTAFYVSRPEPRSDADVVAELVGPTVQLELPELGLTGEAILTDIQTTPEIEAPIDYRDERQVVTTTFHHSSVTSLIWSSLQTSGTTHLLHNSSNTAIDQMKDLNYIVCKDFTPIDSWRCRRSPNFQTDRP